MHLYVHEIGSYCYTYVTDSYLYNQKIVTNVFIQRNYKLKYTDISYLK